MENMYIQRKGMLEIGKIKITVLKYRINGIFTSLSIFKIYVMLYFSYHNSKVVKVIEYLIFNFCVTEY